MLLFSQKRPLPLAATSTLLARGPKSGWNGYVTAAFSGVPRIGDEIRSGYINPTFSEPKSGRDSDVTTAFLGVPRKGDKIRRGYINATFSGAQNRAEW